MNRRDFITGAAVGVVVGAGATAAIMSSQQQEAPTPAPVTKAPEAPAIVKDRIEVAIVTTWPRDFPGSWYRSATLC